MSGLQALPPVSAQLADLYEATRRAWCGGDGGQGVGLSFLLRQGMSAWMRAVPAEAAARSPSSATDGGPGRVATARVAEAASILAAMALGAAKEAAT